MKYSLRSLKLRSCFSQTNSTVWPNMSFSNERMSYSTIFNAPGQLESTVTSARMVTHRKRGEGTQEPTRLSARSATAMNTRTTATTTRPWPTWGLAWTSMASSSAAESATGVRPSPPASTAKRALTATSDRSGCFPTTRHPVNSATALTASVTRGTARQRMVCVSARRLIGGRKTAQLVDRFLNYLGLSVFNLIICDGRTLRATMVSRTVSHVLAALREQGKTEKPIFEWILWIK